MTPDARSRRARGGGRRAHRAALDPAAAGPPAGARGAAGPRAWPCSSARELPRAAALAELDPAQAAEAADALVAAGHPRAGRPLAFMHPLVRAGVYEELAGPTARSRTAVRPSSWTTTRPARSASAEHLLATRARRRRLDRASAWWTPRAPRRGAARPSRRRCSCAARSPSRRPRPSAPGLLLELGIAEATAGQAAGEEHLERGARRRRRRRRRARSGRRSCSRTRSGAPSASRHAVAVVDRTAALLRGRRRAGRRAARDAGADGRHARRRHGAGADRRA